MNIVLTKMSSYLMSQMMRPRAVPPRDPPAVSPVTRTVVAIVAGTRIGLNMMISGVDTTIPTAELASVRPAKPKRATEATEAMTILITSKKGMTKDNILGKMLIFIVCNRIVVVW